MHLRHPCWLGLHSLSLVCLHFSCFHLYTVLQQLRYIDRAFTAVCQDTNSLLVILKSYTACRPKMYLEGLWRSAAQAP